MRYFDVTKDGCSRAASDEQTMDAAHRAGPCSLTLLLAYLGGVIDPGMGLDSRSTYN